MVEIQFQDVTGNWLTVTVVPNIPTQILMEMQVTAQKHPGARIRAVENGRLIDML